MYCSIENGMLVGADAYDRQCRESPDVDLWAQYESLNSRLDDLKFERDDADCDLALKKFLPDSLGQAVRECYESQISACVDELNEIAVKLGCGVLVS